MMICKKHLAGNVGSYLRAEPGLIRRQACKACTDCAGLVSCIHDGLSGLRTVEDRASVAGEGASGEC